MAELVRGQAVAIARRLRDEGWDRKAVADHLRAEGYDEKYAKGAAAFAFKEAARDATEEQK